MGIESWNGDVIVNKPETPKEDLADNLAKLEQWAQLGTWIRETESVARKWEGDNISAEMLTKMINEANWDLPEWTQDVALEVSKGTYFLLRWTKVYYTPSKG